MIFFPGFPTGNPGKTVHKKKTTGNAAGEAEKFYIYHRKEKSPVIEQRQVRQPLQNHVAILPKYSVSEFMGYFREKSKPPPGGGGFFLLVGRALFEGGCRFLRKATDDAAAPAAHPHRPFSLLRKRNRKGNAVRRFVDLPFGGRDGHTELQLKSLKKVLIA